MKINNEDLVRELSKRTELNQHNTRKLLSELIEFIKESVEEDNEVVLLGLCKFYTVNKESRHGRNPKTNESIEIPEKKYLRIKTSQSFKERLQK